MLTADLAMSWQRGDRVNPRYIDAEDEECLRASEDLIALFESHDGRTRAALEESLQEYVGTGTDYRILRGLIKLLTDRCEFETSAPAEPSEIRRALFLKARKRHPVAAAAGREDPTEGAARELSYPPATLMEALYAALPGNQPLTLSEPLTAAELLDLYNV